MGRKRNTERHNAYNRQYSKDRYIPTGRPPSDRDQACGEKHGSARLTWVKVQEIRQRHGNGETVTALAGAFGVGVMTISDVVNCKTWKM